MNWSRIVALVLAVSLLAFGCSDDTGASGNNGSGGNNGTTSNNGGNTGANATSNSCTPQTDGELCEAASATCGEITAEDRCGDTRTVLCGMCTAPDTCNDQNTCECVETDEAFCDRLMKDCGMVTGTDACGAERTIECGACMNGQECGTDNVCECPCRIMGQCVPNGATNPENPCEVCDPGTSTMEWTELAVGSTCDDGLACTENSVCDADAQCVGNLIANTCLIDETCYMDGDDDPATTCRTCDAANDPEDWTNVDAGQTCDDGLACSSNEACDGQGECVAGDITAGTCAIDNTCYDQGDLNPDNPCEVCNPGEDAQGWSDVAAGETCDDGLACTSSTTCDGDGSCTGTIDAGSCAVDGTCYSQDDANPNNACEACDAAVLQTDWSAIADGATCDDGFACTANDVCTTGECGGTIDATACLIDGTCYTDGDTNPGGRTCLLCDAAEDQTDWTQLASGTTCDDGLSCTGDGTCNPGGACRDGDAMAGTCAIDGACYMDGDVNPANPCESCQATLDGGAWSPRGGTTCDDGLACTSNDICTNDGTCAGALDAGSCAIDGSCYANTDANPNNPCEFCDATADPIDWSDTAQNTACDDGLACTSMTVCDGGGACGDGTIAAASCSIDGACFADGDANPLNACEVCDATADQEDWSTATDGSACGAGGTNICCAGSCENLPACNL